MKEGVSKLLFFEEITPAAVICSRGEPLYLGIVTHPLSFRSCETVIPVCKNP